MVSEMPFQSWELWPNIIFNSKPLLFLHINLTLQRGEISSCCSWKQHFQMEEECDLFFRSSSPRYSLGNAHPPRSLWWSYIALLSHRLGSCHPSKLGLKWLERNHLLWETIWLPDSQYLNLRFLVTIHVTSSGLSVTKRRCVCSGWGR